MRELNVNEVNEVNEVNGGISKDLGMALIAGVSLFAALAAAPAAAAFGAGILVVNGIADAM